MFRAHNELFVLFLLGRHDGSYFATIMKPIMKDLRDLEQGLTQISSL